MKLEEIEKEYDENWDENLDEWAVKYGAKLLKIVKCAEELISKCQCCNPEDLQKALEELESL